MPKFLRTGLLILAAFAAAPLAVRATPIEYANFHLLNANQPFSFTNLGGVAAVLSAVNVPVVFNFTSQSGLPTADHAAHLTIASNPVTIPATPLSSLLLQPLNAASMLSIIDDGTGKNLLTLQFTGSLLGIGGSPNANINAAGSEVFGLSSDFGVVTTSDNSLNLGLATLSPTLSIGAGGFLNSFVANINGQFTGNFTANIPEPSTVVLAALAALGAVFFSQRRKR